MKKIKVGKKVIEVKEYINLTKQLTIVDLCVEQFSQMENDIKKLPLIKGIYNLLVLATQTNVTVDGVKVSGGEIYVESTSNEIDEFISNGLFEKCLPLVKNYSEVWEVIYQSIKVYSLAVGMNEAANAMTKSIDDMQAFVNDNDKFVESATNYYAVKQAQEEEAKKRKEKPKGTAKTETKK